jgi:hypothetical protein
LFRFNNQKQKQNESQHGTCLTYMYKS